METELKILVLREFKKKERVFIVCKLKNLYFLNKLFLEIVVRTNIYTEVPLFEGKATELDANCLPFF